MNKKINLDISLINSKNKLKKINFGWYDLNTCKNFREELLKNIIPLIKIKNKNTQLSPSVNLATNIFSKWFFTGLLRLFASLQTKKFLNKRFNKIYTPKKFIFLNKILNDDVPDTLFQNLKNPELKQNKFLRLLKNITRTIQINSFSDFINFKKGGDVVLYTNFLKKNIHNNGEINILRDLKYFFKNRKNNEFNFFENEKFSYSRKDLKEFNLIKKKIIYTFKKFNLELTKNNQIYIDNFIHHCFLFLKYNWKTNKIPKKLHIGTGGSLAWGKLLSALTIFNGGKVINYEHGRGTILHYFVQKFFTDLNYTSKFININKKHQIINDKRFHNLRNKYSMSNFKLEMDYPRQIIKNPFSLDKKEFKKITSKNLKALYVTGVYLGYEGSFRPCLPDIHYLKFQTEIFEILEKLNIKCTLKPHPGGTSQVPKQICELYKINILDEKYEKIVDKIDFDFFIIDHIASTTAPHIINYSKPTIYFDFNFTEINKLIIKDLKSSIKIISVYQNKKGNFKFDNYLFNKYINHIRSNQHLNWKRNIRENYE